MQNSALGKSDALQNRRTAIAEEIGNRDVRLDEIACGAHRLIDGDRRGVSDGGSRVPALWLVSGLDALDEADVVSGRGGGFRGPDGLLVREWYIHMWCNIAMIFALRNDIQGGIRRRGNGLSDDG